MKRMRENGANGKAASAIDIDARRERVASAVGLDSVSELMAEESRGWQQMQSAQQRERAAKRVECRRMAAYVFHRCDELPFRDIAEILQRTEPQVRDSINWIEQRAGSSYVFKVQVDEAVATYGSGAVDRVRKRIARRVGLAVTELVEIADGDSDLEITQRVAAHLLLSEDGLQADEVAKVMCKSETWALAAKDYVSREVRRNKELSEFISQTRAADAGDQPDGGSKSSRSCGC